MKERKKKKTKALVTFEKNDRMTQANQICVSQKLTVWGKGRGGELETALRTAVKQ